MPAQSLQVYREALLLADEVSAILRRPSFARYDSVSAQLASASASIPAQIAEGYGQATDRHFAHYLAISRGGCNEVCAHLAVAKGRELVDETEWQTLTHRYDGLGRRLTRLIQHLREEGRRERG